MDIHFPCPACGGDVEILDTQVGQTIACGHCGTSIDTEVERPEATSPPLQRHEIPTPVPAPVPTPAAAPAIALVPCPACGRQLSSQAPSCPGCGHVISPTSSAVERATQSTCRRSTYVIFGLFLGGLGIHNFYAGRNATGTIQLLITLFTGWMIFPLIIVGLWCLMDVITVTEDGKGNPFT